MIIAIILDNEYNSLKYVDIFENINNNIWTILWSLHRDDFHIRGNFGRYHQSRYQRFKVWFSGDYNVILNLKRCLLLIFITVFTSFKKEISIQIHIAKKVQARQKKIWRHLVYSWLILYFSLRVKGKIIFSTLMK